MRLQIKQRFSDKVHVLSALVIYIPTFSKIVGVQTIFSVALRTIVHPKKLSEPRQFFSRTNTTTA
jgi:hypothetical protein